MTVSTTPTLEGRPISKYRGVIGAEVTFVVPSLNTDIAIGDFAISLTNAPNTKIFEAARQTALSDLIQKARAFGANAIVGLTFSFNMVGNRNQVLLSANATAVVASEAEHEQKARESSEKYLNADLFYFVQMSDGEAGPMPWEEIVQLYNENKISETTLIKETQSKDWVSIKSFTQG